MASPTSPERSSGVVSTVALREELQARPLALAVGPGGTLTIATVNAIFQMPPNGVLSLLAGGKNTGQKDGQGSEAAFTLPSGLAVDQQGTVFVADTRNNRICKVSTDGVVSTLAGSGTKGFVDGHGAAASFYWPRGVGLDPRGNIIVTDRNHAIRMVTPQGLTSTLGGSQEGFRDGPLSQALFERPHGVCVDRSGTIFVADFGNHRIRKISVQGVVSTLAGSGSQGHRDGQGTAAEFNFPMALVLDLDGGLLVTDDHSIRTVSQEGVVCTVAGSWTKGSRDGPTSEASFSYPYGVVVDWEGSLLIADYTDGALRRVTRPISPGTGVASRQPEEHQEQRRQAGQQEEQKRQEEPQRQKEQQRQERLQQERAERTAGQDGEGGQREQKGPEAEATPRADSGRQTQIPRSWALAEFRKEPELDQFLTQVSLARFRRL